MDIFYLTNKLQTNIFEPKSDDDISDRLNYQYTVALLILFAIVITSRQYSAEVIVCWLPAHFTSNYGEYVSHICWVQNTYYVHMNESISALEIDKQKSEIKYYQWVGLFLIFQAYMFYIPRIYWKTYCDRGGLYVGDLISAANKYKGISSFEFRGNYMKYMVNNIDRYVDDKRRHIESRKLFFLYTYAESFLPCMGKYMGNYLVILYIGVKLIYIVNSVLQVYITSVLLGQSFIYLGVDFMRGILTNHDWETPNSKYFPRVSLCDFMIREVGNPNKSHRYTVQCVLPINLFNQQIFTAIWFWFMILTLFNIIAFFKWAKKCWSKNAKDWIKERVSLFNDLVGKKRLQKRLEHFLNNYLEADGIFMIRLIAANSSDYVATDLVHQLWCQHDEKYGHYFKGEPHSLDSSKCEFSHKRNDEKLLSSILRRTCDRKKPKKTVTIDLTENYRENEIKHEYSCLTKLNDCDVSSEEGH